MNKRITTIDGLRGVAVLFVVAFHLINNQALKTPNANFNFFEKALIKITYFGWTGVDLFFVMSGFLIGSILLENKNSGNFFKAFYVRRFLRIIPIYYLLLVIFIVLKNTPIYNPQAYIFKNDLSIGHYFLFVQNFAFSFRNNFGPQAITPTWSLAVEEQFYLIIPWIIYYLKPKHYKYFIVFCLILGPTSRFFCTTFYAKYTLLFCRIDSPIVGFAIALLNRNENFVSLIKNNFKKFQIIILISILISGLVYFFADIGFLNHTILAIIYGALLLLTIYTTKGILYKIFTQKWLVFIGGVSYFVYLYHQLVNGLLHLVFLNHLSPNYENFQSFIITILGFVLTILLSVLSYKYLESKFISYSHRFKY